MADLGMLVLYRLFNFTSFFSWHSLQELVIVGQPYQLLSVELAARLQLVQRLATLGM